MQFSQSGERRLNLNDVLVFYELLVETTTHFIDFKLGKLATKMQIETNIR